MTIGYAVLMARPDIALGGDFAYSLVSAVFSDPVQADNAHQFCTMKRADPGVVYIVCEIHEMARAR